MAPVALSPMALPVGQPESTTAPATTSSVSEPVKSKSAEFNRLARTGKPADALKAWSMAAGCAGNDQWKALLQQKPYANLKENRDYLAELPSREAACGDLSPGQIASRTQYIVTAAKAGVHGALLSLVSIEGPNGMLHSWSKDDPEWAQLEHDAVEASLATADPGALMGRIGTCTEKDVTQCKPDPSALRDWVAAETSRAIDQGKPPPKFDPNRYAKSLSLEVAKKAIADGQTIVATRRQP